MIPILNEVLGKYYVHRCAMKEMEYYHREAMQSNEVTELIVPPPDKEEE